MSGGLKAEDRLWCTEQLADALDKTLLLLPGIEPKLFGCSAHNLVATPTSKAQYHLIIYKLRLILLLNYFPAVQQSPVVQGLLIIEASRSHSDTPYSVRLLWMNDQSVAEASTWQHTTLTRDRHPCLLRDSNPQSYQANGRRPAP
jgi:hypothetical protein